MSCLQSVDAFLMPFFCSAKSPWPWRLGGNSPPCEGPVAWNGCGRRRAATGAPRKKGNLGTRRNLCPGRKQKMRWKNGSNSHHFASLCIFHLFLLVLLLVVIIILTLVMQISFDTYHHSLFWNPPHAKQTPFTSPYQPSHPKYRISQAALDFIH